MAKKTREESTTSNHESWQGAIKEAVIAKADESVASLLGRLEDNQVVVLDKGEFVGMYADSKVLRSRVDTDSMKVRGCTEPATVIQKSDSLQEVAMKLVRSGKQGLPVFDDEKLQGIICIEDVLDLVAGIVEEPKEIKLREPTYIASDERLGALIEQLQKDQLILIGDEKSLEGFATTRIVTQAYLSGPYERDRGQKPRTQSKGFKAEIPDMLASPAKNVMQAEYVTATRKMSSVLQALRKQPAGAIVIEDQQVQGIVYPHDLLRQLIAPESEMNIHYTGISDLPVGESTIRQLKKIASSEAEKLGTAVDNEFSVRIHFKVYSKTGGSHKYTVMTRLHYPGGDVTSENAHAWEVKEALHKSFQDISKQLEYRLRKEQHTDKSIRKGRIF